MDITKMSKLICHSAEMENEIITIANHEHLLKVLNNRIGWLCDGEIEWLPNNKENPHPETITMEQMATILENEGKVRLWDSYMPNPDWYEFMK